VESDENIDLNEESEEKVEYIRPRWWKSLWLLTIISMIASGVLAYFFLYREFVRILIFEVIFSIALGFAYYIRVRPSLRVNKAIYILLGITPIGFGLCLLYGLTGISRYLINLGSGWIWLNLSIFIILLVIGGFIGNWIGKKRDYHLPLSLNRRE